MTRKTYCGNLLWQSGLTLLARLIYKDEMTQDYMLRRLPANDGNTEDGSDEICEWDD